MLQIYPFLSRRFELVLADADASELQPCSRYSRSSVAALFQALPVFSSFLPVYRVLVGLKLLVPIASLRCYFANLASSGVDWVLV